MSTFQSLLCCCRPIDIRLYSGIINIRVLHGGTKSTEGNQPWQHVALQIVGQQCVSGQVLHLPVGPPSHKEPCQMILSIVFRLRCDFELDVLRVCYAKALWKCVSAFHNASNTKKTHTHKQVGQAVLTISLWVLDPLWLWPCKKWCRTCALRPNCIVNHSDQVWRKSVERQWKYVDFRMLIFWPWPSLPWNQNFMNRPRAPVIKRFSPKFHENLLTNDWDIWVKRFWPFGFLWPWP